MRIYYIIDENGFYIEYVFSTKIDIDSSKYIEVPPVGFKKPRWNGSTWTEGWSNKIDEIPKEIRIDNITYI
jgi:hypothetical protein